MEKNPLLLCDYYKLGHYFMQPKGVERVYATWTARSNKYHEGCTQTVVFGTQYFIQKYLIEYFNEYFFNKDFNEIEKDYLNKVKNTFNSNYANTNRFEQLHKLGYLPIEVWGLPEGSLINIKIPQCAIWNTHKDFGWLPQYLEDIWSTNMWLPSTSATTAYYRRKDLQPFIEATCDNPQEVLKHICGDFSMRGMTSLDSAFISSAGHCLSFDRTATIEANGLLEKYYMADIANKPPALGAPSLEHSVVCQGVAYFQDLIENDIDKLDIKYQAYIDKVKEDWDIKLIAEMCFIIHLLTEVQPNGLLTYVSDTYDYWGVLTKILPIIKDIIINRDGKFCPRPDSGNPEYIICGDPISDNIHIQKGSIQILADIFGYEYNTKSFKVLNSHIGLIYGDAITKDVAYTVANRLMKANWATSNIIFGIGAYTYQYVTRDTRGFAIKASYCEIDDKPIMMYKEPKTDDGTKKSIKGCAVVYCKEDEFKVKDNYNLKEACNHSEQEMIPLFKDGNLLHKESIYDIRNRLYNERF